MAMLSCRIAIVSFAFLCVPVAWGGPEEEWAFTVAAECRDLVHPQRRAPEDWRQRSGAVTLNAEWEKDRSKSWYIELQREGARWVEAGLAHGDREGMGWGLRQLAWGFRQMKEDGSFDCDDRFHSASFLVEAAARSILLIESSPHADAFRAELASLKPPLLTCARWMASPVNFRAAEQQRIYTHRRFLLGCAFLQCSRLHDDAVLRRTAEYFIEDGLRLQRADGAFPEKGGHDSSYHAVSLIYLQRLLRIAPAEQRQPSWDAALRRGTEWMLSRIDAEGVVSVRGNTRTGAGQETGRGGKVKEINRREVALALIGVGRHELAAKVLTAP
ncbi:MAG: hypothetical protein EAZ84_02610 [Verrucomicrobia bacterium]|nr:MAG: hypothetical protein EAZ84_02610 [Verrucomicrobiota bacterium]